MFVVCQTGLLLYSLGISLCDEARLLTVGAILRRFSVGEWSVGNQVGRGVAK